MLSAKVQDGIEKIMRENALDASDYVIMDVLVYVMGHYRLSDDVIQELARLMRVPFVRLYRQIAMTPVLKSVSDTVSTLKVCDGLLCYLQGGRERLGEISRVVASVDEVVSVEHVPCMGLCHMAPVVSHMGQERQVCDGDLLEQWLQRGIESA